MILVLSDFTLIHTFMDLFYEYKDQQKRIQNPDKHLRTEKRLQLFNYVFIREITCIAEKVLVIFARSILRMLFHVL